jgi:hypothetical protein
MPLVLVMLDDPVRLETPGVPAVNLNALQNIPLGV